MQVACGAVPLISARGVRHTFGSGELAVQALAGVDIDVWPGEMVAVMGPSGSGKSTLMHLLCGIELIQEGQVRVGDVAIHDLDDKEIHRYRRRKIGMIFQNFNLLPSLTAVENVSLPLELDGVVRRDARAAAVSVLDDLGIGDLAGRFPDQLSGGQQQRIAIGRALVGGAEVMLADEPTGSLDTASGRQVLALLRSRAVDRQAAVLVVTHDVGIARECDRVVELRDGAVFERGDSG